MKSSKVNVFRRKYCLNCNSNAERGRVSSNLPIEFTRRRSKTLDSETASTIARDFASIVGSELASVLAPPKNSGHSHIVLSTFSNLKIGAGSFLHGMRDIIRNQFSNMPSQKSFEEIIEENSRLIEADPREKYRILNTLGQGAFGCVYKVKDMDTGEDYAIKRLSPTNEELKQEILQEIALLKICNHPNILKLYDGYRYEG